MKQLWEWNTLGVTLKHWLCFTLLHVGCFILAAVSYKTVALVSVLSYHVIPTLSMAQPERLNLIQTAWTILKSLHHTRVWHSQLDHTQNFQNVPKYFRIHSLRVGHNKTPTIIHWCKKKKKKNCPTSIGKNYFACFVVESFFSLSTVDFVREKWPVFHFPINFIPNSSFLCIYCPY